MRSSARGTLGFLVAAALVVSGTIAAAQSPPSPFTTDQLLANGCGVGIRAVQALADPGHYLVTFLVPAEAPPVAAVVRVDDRNGHWLYPPTAARQVVVVVPASPIAPVNVSLAAAHPPTGQDVPCLPSVNPPRASSDAAIPDSHAVTLLPASHDADAPASCDVPFDKGGVVIKPPSGPLPRELRGSVALSLLVMPDGSVSDSRVVSASSAEVGAALAQVVQEQLRMSPTVFRCAPVTSRFFFAMQFRPSSSH